MRRPAPLAVAALLALGVAGCGDADLWARWRADRALFHAARAAEAARGRRAPDRARARAEHALESLASAFPAARWGAPPARGPARDVAIDASRAALLHARLAEDAGEWTVALVRYRDARKRWGALEGASIGGRAGAARMLERLDRPAEALRERLALAGLDPLGDPDGGGPSADVLDAAPAVAAELRANGRPAEAESVLVAAESRFAAALARASVAQALPLAGALANVRAALGDGAGALAALRTTLDGVRAWEVPGRALAIGRFAFGTGMTDSAIAYARWASSATNWRSVAGPALLLAARAWEEKGVPDSAFAAYDALFERWSDPGALEPEARFRRAELLASLGQWERARADFAALAAASPTDPFAFEAPLAVVRHHLDRGEYELARLEGGNALERIDYLIRTNRDPDVQRRAGLTRAELLLGLGFAARAESSLVDLWRRFPEDSSTESGALRGAALAEHRPGGRPAALEIYDALSKDADYAVIRREASRRLAALAAAGRAREDTRHP